MKDEDEATATQRRLIEEMTAEALAGPYVHEECGDTMWDEVLAETNVKKEEE
jgi:hypothetical protein